MFHCRKAGVLSRCPPMVVYDGSPKAADGVVGTDAVSLDGAPRFDRRSLRAAFAASRCAARAAGSSTCVSNWPAPGFRELDLVVGMLGLNVEVGEGVREALPTAPEPTERRIVGTGMQRQEISGQRWPHRSVCSKCYRPAAAGEPRNRTIT